MTVIQTALRTTGYWLAPEMEWKNGHGTVKGYIVHNQIEIRIDNLNLLSDVIDAVNATRNTSLIISGLRFTLKDQNAAESEAIVEIRLSELGCQRIVLTFEQSRQLF